MEKDMLCMVRWHLAKVVFCEDRPCSVKVTTNQTDSRVRLWIDNISCEFLSLHPS